MIKSQVLAIFDIHAENISNIFGFKRVTATQNIFGHVKSLDRVEDIKYYIVLEQHKKEILHWREVK